MPNIDIGSTLTRKIGPLPAWAYAVLIAGAAWAVYLYRKSHAKNTPAPTVGTEGVPTDSASDSQIAFPGQYLGTIDSTGVSAGGSTGGTTVAGTTPLTSNSQWFATATNWLTAQGYDAATVQQALNNFLLGEQASAQDRALYNLAVAQFGVPPEGVPLQPTSPPPVTPGLPGGSTAPPGTPAPPSPPTPAPPPPPAPVPPAPQQRTFVVTKYPAPGSSLWSIAQIEYGDGNKWPTIYNANRAIIGNNPNLIHAGTRLVIP
jgi:nucleoid-associated protein YgaU